jgi:signal transduction histidine kinase
MIDEIPTGVITADARQASTFLNRAARSILRLPPDAPPGGPVLALFDGHPELRRALGAGGAAPEARFDCGVRAPDGRALELAMVVIRASGGASVEFGHVLLFQDARDRRQRATERLRDDRLAALGQMAMGFAHEVRNPLAAMTALCEAMAYDVAEGAPQYQYAMRLLALIERMGAIVKGTLRFGRPEEPNFRVHQPARLLDEALELIAPRCAWVGGRPRARVAPGLAPVRVDGGQIVQVLVALFDNALDAVGRPDRICVSLEPFDDMFWGPALAFDVTDDGPGIEADALSRVFDPFYTTKPRGTGLGLSIAQRLVAENGGRLMVRSEPGVATTFRVALPAFGASGGEAPAGGASS